MTGIKISGLYPELKKRNSIISYCENVVQ